MGIKVDRVSQILNVAMEARKKGYNLVPCLKGHAGLGKSQGVHQWVKKQRETDKSFGYLDLRLALKEAPDLCGYPSVERIEGMSRTVFALPDFWPTSGKGVVFIDEINRGNNAVMNAVFQLLTERSIGQYQLPEGWIMCCAMNPDTEHYSVSAVDQALMDRMVIFDVEYDAKSFFDFAENHFHEKVVSFLKSGQWTYLKPEQCKQDSYVSPRTWERVSMYLSGLDAVSGGTEEIDPIEHRLWAVSTLGSQVGSAFHSFLYEESPVLAKDILKDREGAFKKLSKYADKKKYRGDMITATMESVMDNYCGEMNKDKSIDLTLIFDVMELIPADQVVNYLMKIMQSDKNKVDRDTILNEVKKRKSLRDSLNANLENFVNI